MADYFHFFDKIEDKAGNALPGYFVGLVDADGSPVDLFSDDNSTPIETVSGEPNKAKADGAGNVSLFVAFGTFDLNVYAPDAVTLVFTIPKVPMLTGPKGDKGDTGSPRVAETLADLKAALTGDVSIIYDHATFTWTEGDYTGKADDTNIIKSDYVDLSEGAWVRQAADKVAFQVPATGAKLRDAGEKLAENVSAQDFAVGDGVADDTAALSSAMAAASSVTLTKSYRVDALPVAGRLVGQNYNLLRSHSAESSILKLGSSSVIEDVEIDGEGAVTRQADVGGTGARDIMIRHIKITNCPTNSFRGVSDTSGVILCDVFAEGSKIWNTFDTSTVSYMIFSRVINRAIANEGLLIDFPGSTAEWTSFTIANCLMELSDTGQRCAGASRAVGGTVDGNVFRGAYNGTFGEDNDLLHFEDKAEGIVVSGNMFDLNGATHGVDGASGGDPTYPQDDRDPKDLFFTGNLYRAKDDRSEAMVWLEGTSPAAFDRISVVGEHLSCFGNTLPVRARLNSGVVGRNMIYNAPSAEIASVGDEITADSSRNGAEIIRPASYYANPRFVRAAVKHGYAPDNVLFRTSFGFADFTAFTTWAGALKTIAGNTFFSTAGSLGTGGSITMETDAATGARFLRATRGSTGMSTHIDFEWPVEDIDFQNLDNIVLRLMTRSSVQGAGLVTMAFPLAGPSAFTFNLNLGDDFASWTSDGGSKVAPVSANFFAAGAGTVKITIDLGNGLVAAGDTFDIALMAVSHLRATPF